MYLLMALFFLFGQAQPQTQPQSQTEANQLAKIEGRVVHSLTGEPVRRAHLTLNMRSMTTSGAAVGLSATTDDEGKFHFDKVEPGTYMLMAERTGFVRQQYNSRAGGFMGTPITVRAGEQLGDITFKLLPQSVIAGRVVNDEGEPVQHASVSVIRQSGSGQGMGMMGAQTNDLGEFRIADLTPGRYLVRAIPGRNFYAVAAPPPLKEGEKRRQSLLPTYYPGVTDISAASPVELTAGQQLTGISIQLQKGFVNKITGKISVRPGPGRMVRVMLAPRQRTPSMSFSGGGSGVVKPDGTFELQEVQSGSYQLLAMENEMTGGRPVTIARAAVDVADQDVEGVVLQVQPPVDISGAVRVEGEKPVKVTGMRLTLMPADSLPFNTPNAVVSEEGTFQLSGVIPDRYFLNYFGGPQDYYVRAARFGTDDALKGFQVTGGGKLDIVLAPGAAILQGLVQQNDKPYQGAFVMVVPEPFGPETTHLRKMGTSDQNGRYEFKGLAPGDYRVYALPEPIMPMPTEAEELKPFENKSVKVTVREGATEQKDISVSEKSKQ